MIIIVMSFGFIIILYSCVDVQYIKINDEILLLLLLTTSLRPRSKRYRIHMVKSKPFAIAKSCSFRDSYIHCKSIYSSCRQVGLCFF